MKRDFDLIRQILFALEDEEEYEPFRKFSLEGVPEPKLQYHLKIMGEARLIDVEDLGTSDGPDWHVKSLTWNGQDFLEKSRNETCWKQAKQTILEKGGALTLDILTQILSTIALKQMGIV
jgi:hypothetical protein